MHRHYANFLVYASMPVYVSTIKVLHELVEWSCLFLLSYAETFFGLMDPRISLAYTARTLHQLEQLRVDYKWTDVILFADGSEREFPAHRCVLASASPYFRAMLVNGAFVEANKGSVTLKGVTDNGIQILLEFIYSGEVKLSVERISEALKVGTLTQVRTSFTSFLLAM